MDEWGAVKAYQSLRSTQRTINLNCSAQEDRRIAQEASNAAKKAANVAILAFFVSIIALIASLFAPEIRSWVLHLWESLPR